jgi:hypothetical protein
METSAMTVSVSSFQILMALAFQIWLIVFPIILIRKINYLTALLQEHLYPETDRSEING